MFCTGLDPDDDYEVVMDIVPVGDKLFKFQDPEWVVQGIVEREGNDKVKNYVHPATPSSGLEKQRLTFEKCKITNHENQFGYVSAQVNQ